MSLSDPKICLKDIYDERYLQFVSEVLRSSRYYTNLRDQLQQNPSHSEDQSFQEHREDASTTILYCRETDSKECNIENTEVWQDFSSDPDIVDNDCVAETDTVLIAGANYLFNNDLYINDSDSSEETPTSSTTRPVLNKKIQGKKSKKKKKSKTNSTFDGFGGDTSSMKDNDIRDIVKSAIAIDIRKQAHTNIFTLKDEDLEELRNIYGQEADVILKLEQQQELTFQKACDKITPGLLKYSYS